MVTRSAIGPVLKQDVGIEHSDRSSSCRQPLHARLKLGDDVLERAALCCDLRVDERRWPSIHPALNLPDLPVPRGVQHAGDRGIAAQVRQLLFDVGAG
jgi:hypothetical protein